MNVVEIILVVLTAVFGLIAIGYMIYEVYGVIVVLRQRRLDSQIKRDVEKLRLEANYTQHEMDQMMRTMNEVMRSGQQVWSQITTTTVSSGDGERTLTPPEVPPKLGSQEKVKEEKRERYNVRQALKEK